MTNEPVAVGGTILAACQAVLAVLIAFGVHLTTDQTAALQGLVVALTAAVTLIVRAHVTPWRAVGAPTPAEHALAHETAAAVRGRHQPHA